MNKSEAFAYSFDAELVRSVHPGWPENMSLFLCMKSDGSCRTVIFHSEEGSRALRRVAAVLDLPTRSFPVSPEVRGWPTRTVRYSEEHDMLAIIAGVPDLAEKAREYAEAHARDREEKASAPAKAEDGPAAGPVESEPAKKASRRLNLGLARSDAADRILRKVSEKPTPLPVAMPVGFAPGAARGDCRFDSGHIGVVGGNVRIVLAPDRMTIRTAPVLVTEIGFSADFWRFYLPRSALQDWVPGKSAVMDIPVECFPEALRGAFVGRLFHVDATITAEGIFLAPGGPVAAPAAARPQETPKPAAAPRRRWLTPLRAAAAACVVAGTAAAAVNIVPMKSGTGGVFDRILTGATE